MSSSSTNRMSLTGARYAMLGSSLSVFIALVRQRRNDVRRGELDEALHPGVVLETGGKHRIQWRGRRRLPIGEHLAQLGGGDALAAQEFRQQADAESGDRRAV